MDQFNIMYALIRLRYVIIMEEGRERERQRKTERDRDRQRETCRQIERDKEKVT